MNVAISGSSPVVSLGREDYVVRIARVVEPEYGEREPDHFAVVAFSREGEGHVPLSGVVNSLDEARAELTSGFEPPMDDFQALAIIRELLATGQAQRLS